MSRNQQFLCCDVNSRLSSDVISLVKETKKLLVLQKSYDLYEEQKKTLLTEFNKKINILRQKSEVCDLIAPQINEFINLILTIWENAREFLRKKSEKNKYLTEDGLPIVFFVHKLTTFIEHIYSKYYQIFVHQQCCSTFLHLSNQISNIIYPEVSQADVFEQKNSYLINSTAFLINLHYVIDAYLRSKKLDVVSFFTQLFSEEPMSVKRDMKLSKDFLPLMVLSSSLKGELLERGELETTPMAANKHIRFYKLILELTYFLLKLRPPAARSRNNHIHYKGSLDAPYANPLFAGTQSSSLHRSFTTIRGRGRVPRSSYGHKHCSDTIRIE